MSWFHKIAHEFSGLFKVKQTTPYTSNKGIKKHTYHIHYNVWSTCIQKMNNCSYKMGRKYIAPRKGSKHENHIFNIIFNKSQHSRVTIKGYLLAYIPGQ